MPDTAREPTTAPQSPSPDAPTATYPWRGLPFEVLRALRAAAFVGPAFNLDAVAALLRCEALDVLERLQHAVDLGVPLTDAGAGRFTLPDGLQPALRDSTLPALAAAWQRRLGSTDKPASPAAPARDAAAPATVSHAVAATANNDTATANNDTAAAAIASNEVAATANNEVAATANNEAAATANNEAAATASHEVAAIASHEVAATASHEVAATASNEVAATAGNDTAAATPASNEVAATASNDTTTAATAGHDAAPASSAAVTDPPARTEADADAPATRQPDPLADTTDVAAAPAKPRSDAPTSTIDSTTRTTASGTIGAASGPTADAEAPARPDAPPAASDLAAPRPARPTAAALASQPTEMLVVSELELLDSGPSAPPPAPQPTEMLVVAELELLDGAAGPAAEARPRPASSPPPRAPSRRSPPRPQVLPRLEDGAQDDHLQLDFLSVAREAADRGDSQLAAETLRRALGTLGARPVSPAHLRLRILGQIELGRLQWQAQGTDLGFTLNQALGTLDAVRAEFGADASSDIAVELCAVIAGVCFDLGDMGSLARALEELTIARRLLESTGGAVRAARLLNQQAAVLMRMGDTAQAKELLRESRKFFQARENDDPVAMRELAETDHLTAWLPLHATMVPGREQDGFRAGLERAAAAEQVFSKLDDARELARVWETMGRLERHLQRFDEATQHLEAAAGVQRRLGDLIGLARTTETMSDVLAQRGRDAEAIALLGESVRHNHEKGSLIGLFHNRRAFTDFAVRLATRTEHATALGELARQLGAAEREVELGRAQSMIRT